MRLWFGIDASGVRRQQGNRLPLDRLPPTVPIDRSAKPAVAAVHTVNLATAPVTDRATDGLDQKLDGLINVQLET